MLIESRSLWLAETNCYVVAPERGSTCVVVDAPPDVEGIAALLRDHDLVPVALLVTHAHIDHVGGAGGAAARWNMSAYLHPDDGWLAADPLQQLQMLFGASLPPGFGDDFAPPDRFETLVDGARLELAGLALDVIHTPGHTPGHCCFHLADEGVLFSGDQLFAGSIGRTDLPGGDYQQLMGSMQSKVLTLPDATRVLPGHGPATTISHERLTNPFLIDL